MPAQNNKKIDVWIVSDISTLTHEQAETYRSWLDDVERQRLAQFHFDVHRCQYLVTRAMQRAVLSLYHAHITPAEWRFTKGAHGKPSIDPAMDVLPHHFSLSNTEGMIMMAISTEVMLGVDVEIIRDHSIIEVAESCFDVSEVAQLQALAGDTQLQRFYELWTLKESYLKALGTGLTSNLDSIVFSGSENDSSYWLKNGGTAMLDTHWHFWKLFNQSSHIGALALGLIDADANVEIEVREATPALQWHPGNPCLSKIR